MVTRGLQWMVVLAVVCWGSACLGQERYVRFEIEDRSDLAIIERIVSIDHVDGTRVWAYGSDDQIEALRKHGFEVESLPHPGINPDARMIQSKRSMTYPLSAYPTYQQYVQELQDFAANYPNICELHDFGDSTNILRPHDLLALKITDNPEVDEDEPEVFYTSTMHGDETTGYILMMNLINELLTHYVPGSSDPYEQELTDMVDSMEIWINPLANPDGTYKTSDTTVSGASRYFVNPDGTTSFVDPNRNFPDPDDGPHPDGHPYWQETVAMMDFADAHDFVLSANFHGGAEVANYPWDTWARLHADDAWFVDVCRLYADTVQPLSPAGYFTFRNNGITNGYAWYHVAGGRQDFMNYWYGCREITIELSDTKNPPASDLVDYWDWNRRALLDYLKQALEGVRGMVTDPSGNPLDAMIEVVGHDVPEDQSYVYTDPAIGDYHRMLLSGTYTLRVSSYGFITQDVPDVIVVEDTDAVRQDVILQPESTVTVTGTVTSAFDQSPIAGATVTIQDTPLDPATTDGTGGYSIDNVLENVYLIAVEADGYLSLEQERTVAIGQTIHDFQLSPIDVVYFSDLEPDNGGLIGNTEWEWGQPGGASPAPYSPDKVWATDLDGSYGNNVDAFLDLENVALPAIDPRLTFWQWYAFEPTWDGGRVEISTDGVSFLWIAPNGGYTGIIRALNDEPGYGGSSNAWVQATFDLSDYAGQTVTLRWHFASDGSQTRLGWYLDDVRIFGALVDPIIFADGFESGDCSAWNAIVSDQETVQE